MQQHECRLVGPARVAALRSRDREASTSEPLQTAANLCIYIVSTSRSKRAMIVEFCRLGNSLAVRIPKAVADALNVSDGKRAEIIVKNGALVLRPIVKPRRKPRYTLDELLRAMTKDDVPQEI